MLIVQGDVFLTESKIPTTAVKMKLKSRGLVIAEGEHTGHAHVVDNTDVATLYEVDGVMYLSNSEPISIVHEEHKSINVPTGEWKIGIVKEVDPFTDEIRNVQD
jgi:hypothetical protein